MTGHRLPAPLRAVRHVILLLGTVVIVLLRRQVFASHGPSTLAAAEARP